MIHGNRVAAFIRSEFERGRGPAYIAAALEASGIVIDAPEVILELMEWDFWPFGSDGAPCRSDVPDGRGFSS